MESVVKEITTEKPKEELETRTDVQSDSESYLTLCKFFDLESQKLSGKDRERMKEVYEWCKDDSEAQMFNKLVTKRHELGAPRLGESRLFQMYTWLRLSKDYELAKENLLKYEGAEVR